MNNLTKNIRFSDAKESELPFIVEVYNQTIASRMVTADTLPITVDSRHNWYHSHNPQTRPLWIIWLNDLPCGWISLSTFYGRPAYDKTVEISLYIHSDYRGQKVGQYAAYKLEQFAQQQGIETILSYIFGHNAPSLALFKKLGYEQWGHLPKVAELDKIKRDLIILGKSIIK
ncbi:phosphinothricin acetyltransferase [Orbus hercynius]|uniref:Phosphinothricin acetyltransferase n=1 Tax=Orbus hercynius TaxID=593135 RepID=A0A495RJ53_9GAMM|nr:GNAT family N-acetyltransferase [Orbus hercynius]RKS87537.1 phosphinothricin acetyltransferase [Orbus hercynius]